MKNKPRLLLENLKTLNFDELLFRYRYPLTFLLVGLSLLGLGLFLLRGNVVSDKIEVLESGSGGEGEDLEIVVEIAGAVENPGVYKFEIGARVEDVLIAAGGVSADADRSWMEKFLNRAVRLSDGQKIYIPRVGQSLGIAQDKQLEGASARNSEGYQSVSSVQGSSFEGLININTASASELESLWGIGPVYAQKIIEQRPYSSVEELLTRKIIKKNVYERNKEYFTIY